MVVNSVDAVRRRVTVNFTEPEAERSFRTYSNYLLHLQVERATGELLALPDRVTAIFCGNNRITIGALRALRRHRGRRVAVVGLDDFELADMLSVPVVAYEPAELGRRAAQLLFRRIQGGEGRPQRIVVPTHLVARGSGEVRA